MRAVFDASMRPLDATSNDPPTTYTPSDAAGCGCQLGSDGVLRVSWSCFQKRFSTSPKMGWCGSPGGWTSACGLDVFTYDNPDGLQEKFVYDQSGVQVGAHYQNIDVPFACPDSLLESLTVESGTLPASTCASTPCTCNFDRGDGSFTCPPPLDAGAADAGGSHDAGPP
jgi:hypothetical protein